MRIGIPRENEDGEYRVGISPAGVRELVRLGHQIIVESGAGEGSSVTDQVFQAAGASIASDPTESWGLAELILKVREPTIEECGLLHSGQTLFSFLHLATDKELTEALVATGATAISYETVQELNGKLPLLAPMSEIAGRMAPQIGANLLEKVNGGRGVLLGAVSGVAPAKVVVLGAGTVGMNAARMATGLEAHVTVLDTDLDRLRYLDDLLFGRITTLVAHSLTIDEEVASADLVIGSILVPGAISPVMVTEEVVKSMRKGSVIIDVSVDQGGCVETTVPTTHSDPVYEKHGVLHYAVSNIPGAVPRTSTFALTNASLPFVSRMAELGIVPALKASPALAAGVSVMDGHLTSRPAAMAHDIECFELSSLVPPDLY